MSNVDKTIPTMWLTKFKALEEFWKNPENSFKVPRQYSDSTKSLFTSGKSSHYITLT